MSQSVLGFLQARMGSTRLPGKVLLRLEGKTILERAILRLQAARTVDAVVVLTTILEADDALEEEARRLGVEAYRGPDQDVLRRFQQAAAKFRPDIVVRATADNPLIDIGSVERIVRAVQTSCLEYCVENNLPIGAATEALTARALQRVDSLATHPFHREHVTLYIKEHPELFRVAFLAPPDVLCRPDVRITVDTPGDFMFVEELIHGVPEAAVPLPLEHFLPCADALCRARKRAVQ